MASTPSNRIKLTPTNSPFPSRPSRSLIRPRPLYDSCLSLQRVIGTTCSSPTGFDTVHSSFAYIAGGAVVVVDVSGEHYSQRFYRARPNAVPLLSVSPTSHTSSSTTPISTPKANDSRNRAAPSPRGGSDSPYHHHTSTITSTSSLDWPDHPSSFSSTSSPSTSKTWTSRERIKAATCLSLSRDGRYLAVGETGYAPRVLVFNLHDAASSDTPLVAISEQHTFGVKAVAWSPDTRYLASLGTANDGFLYLWRVDPRSGGVRLWQQNRCTSFVKGMVWMGSGSLITFGVRHVKLWRVDEGGGGTEKEVSPTKGRFPPHHSSASSSSVEGAAAAAPLPREQQQSQGQGQGQGQSQSQKPLQGRNILLGSMLDATFCCALPVSDDNVVICSEMGAVCVLDVDDSNKQTKLVKVLDLGFHITCISSRGENVYIGGKDGQFAFMTLATILAGSPEPTIRSSPMAAGLTAMGFLAENLVTIDNKRSIDVWSAEDVPQIPEEDGGRIPIPGPGDPIVGIQRLAASNRLAASFFTWSGSGRVNIWDLGGMIRSSFNIPIEQTEIGTEADPVNQVVVARATNDGSLFIAGDKLGVLRIVEASTGDCLLETKAHSSNCQDIALYEGESRFLVASCGRDRTVQLFHRSSVGEFEHFQTLEFSARVVQVLIPSEDKVVTCSLDRTLQIHDLVCKEGEPDAMAAIPCKVVSLRASPSSMAVTPDNKTVFVSLLDRSVCQFDFASGRLLGSFKCNDEAGLDSVILESLTHGHLGNGEGAFLVGISNTDKSVRVYDAQSGAFMDREWGHTEAINGVVLTDGDDNNRKVVSVGEDGTIMVWALDLQDPIAAGGGPRTREPSPDKAPALASTRPPLRRVLSKAELAEFQRPSQSPSTATTISGRRPSPPRPSSHRRPSKFHTLPFSSLRTPTAAEKQHPSPTSSVTTATTSTTTTPTATTAILIDDAAQETPSRRGSSGGGSRSDNTNSPPPPDSPKTNGHGNNNNSSSNRPPSSAAMARMFSRRPSLPALGVSPCGLGLHGSKSRKNSSSSLRSGTPGVENVNGGGSGTGTGGGGGGGGGNKYGFGSLGMATEQTCRQLRAYRKKLASASADAVGMDVLAQLEHELRLTASLVADRRGGGSSTPGGGTARSRPGRGSRNSDREMDPEIEMALGLGIDMPGHYYPQNHHHGKAVSESLLSGLLDQYSERLVSMLDEKLRLRMAGLGGSEDSELTVNTTTTDATTTTTTTATTATATATNTGNHYKATSLRGGGERECDCDSRDRERDRERPRTAGESSDAGGASASGESNTGSGGGVLCEEPESVC